MRKLLVAAFALWSASASAADLAPNTEEWFTIDEDTAVLVSYAPAPGGFEVFAIVEQRGEMWPTLFMVRSRLMPGQLTEITVPQVEGQAPQGLVVVRDGDTVRVEPMPVALAAR